jgi:hypothetical protein
MSSGGTFSIEEASRRRAFQVSSALAPIAFHLRWQDASSLIRRLLLKTGDPRQVERTRLASKLLPVAPKACGHADCQDFAGSAFEGKIGAFRSLFDGLTHVIWFICSFRMTRVCSFVSRSSAGLETLTATTPWGSEKSGRRVSTHDSKRGGVTAQKILRLSFD